MRTTLDVRDRFWSKVDRSGDCWVFSSLRKNGYGRLLIDHRFFQAHRVSWELHNGPIPDGLWVLHRCDNPACVRPDHLFLGTHADNMADRHAKERDAACERHGRARLTAADVREIRRHCDNRTKTQTELAADYGVAQSNISMIALRVTWRRLP